MKLFKALLFIVAVSPFYIHAAQINTVSFPKMDKFLKENDLNWHCNPTNLKNWSQYVSEELNQEMKRDRKSEKKESAKLVALEFLDEELKTEALLPWPNRLHCESLSKAYEIIYAIEASEHEPDTMNVFDYLSVLNKINHTIPYLDESERTKPLFKGAYEEAVNLVNPKNESQFLRLNEMQAMSSKKLSEMDISENHPAWRKYNFIPSNNLWAEQERKIETIVNSGLSKKEKEQLGPFSIAEAHKVVFLEKLKTTATSPKINTTDIWGQKWKMKWGNETQSEPIANRLALLAGAKYSDLTYSIPHGEKSTYLVLGDRTEKSSCENVNTYEWLRYCLITSIYKFELNPYVYKRGFITKDNANKIFGDKFDASEYYGREFVQFKEVQLEFNIENVFKSVGVWSKNDFLPLYDRVQRGLLIFNSWIAHNDDKEDNTKVFLDDSTDNTEMFAYESDLGSTLGDKYYPGSVNDFKVGDDFMSVGRSLFRQSILNSIMPRIIGPKRVFVHLITPFRTKTWDYITFADARWMARYIARIPVAEIRKAVEASNWPNYMIEAMTHRLIDRRNHLAKIFGVEDLLDVKSLKPVRISVDLSTPELRKKYADMFHLNPEFIDYVLKKEKKRKSNYREWLVYDNKLKSCEDSVITYALEKAWHPAGIARRQKRTSVAQGLPECR